MERHAFDRQPDETDAAWQAFATYRDMGPGRSLAKVGRALGKSTTLLSGWSSKHHWLMRVAEFDRFLDAQKVAAEVEAVTEMWRRHANIAMLGQQQALAWLRQVDPTQLRDEVGVRLLQAMTQLEQVARGAQVADGGGVLEPAGPTRTLAQLFQVPADGGVTELTLARMVVERTSRNVAVDGLEPEDDPDDDDPVEAPMPAAAVAEPATSVPEEAPAHGLVAVPDPPAEEEPAATDGDQKPKDDVAEAWQFLREYPRRPAPGDLLVRWLRSRQLVGLDPPEGWRPPPRRYRARRPMSAQRR